MQNLKKINLGEIVVFLFLFILANIFTFAILYFFIQLSHFDPTGFSVIAFIILITFLPTIIFYLIGNILVSIQFKMVITSTMSITFKFARINRFIVGVFFPLILTIVLYFWFTKELSGTAPIYDNIVLFLLPLIILFILLMQSFASIIIEVGIFIIKKVRSSKTRFKLA